MSRSIFTLVSLCLLCALLGACEGYKHRFAEPYPAPGMVVNWPGVSYDEVRGYCYDYTADTTETFLDPKVGKMHAGVMDRSGVKLSDSQVQRLLRAITVSQPKGPRTPCYKPHHAFVFFKQGKPVAVFEMCFGCNRQKSYPTGIPEYVDRAALWDLTKELGLPLGRGNEFYAEVCRSGRR